MSELKQSENKTGKKGNDADAQGKKVFEEALVLDENIKNYDFADYVQVRSFPRGVLLSFGKSHPEYKKNLMFKEILLPFEVAASVSDIITKQITELKEKGLLTVEKNDGSKESRNES